MVILVTSSLYVCGCNTGDTAGDQIVAFTDPNLEEFIRVSISKPEGAIHVRDLGRLTYLNAVWRNIADLKGLEHCPNLAQLYLDDNQLSDITPLASLKRLKYLSLRSFPFYPLKSPKIDFL